MTTTDLATSPNTDPYLLPFNWPTTMPAECAEERLYDQLPCAYQCEAGWLPTVEGGAIGCPTCNSCDREPL